MRYYTFPRNVKNKKGHSVTGGLKMGVSVAAMGVMGGGETWGHVLPPRFEGWGTQYQMSPPRFELVCVSPLKVLYPYKFRLERGLKLCIFSSPNTKFS